MRLHCWRGLRACSVLFFALLLTASSVWAQDAFVTGPNNSIVRIDFETGKTEVRVRDNGKKFLGLVMRQAAMGGELRLIVANKTGGGDLRVYNESTGRGARIAKFKSAVAVALNAQGDLFAVNGTNGGKDQVMFVDKVPRCPDRIRADFPKGCLPGGYEKPVFIDERVYVRGAKIKELADIRVARGDAQGLFQREQVLVLVKKPAMVLAYTPDHHGFGDCDGHCDPSIVVPKGVIHGTPQGLEIVGDSILVTLKERRILRIRNGAGGIETKTFADLPGKGAKLAVGQVGNDIAVFASVSNVGGRALVFDSEGIQQDEQRKGVKVPNGITTPTNNVVSTAAGSGVGQSLTQLDTTFTTVVKPGITNSVCQFYDHPRPDCSGDDCEVSLMEFGFDDDVVFPSHLQPFPVGDEDGPKQFLICKVDTTADIQDTIQNIHEELNSIGYDPGCETFNSNTGMETRMAWAPIPVDEPEIVEGNRFIDITVGCGNSHRGRGWEFSYISPIISNQRCTPEQIDDRFTQLAATIDAAGTNITGPCADFSPDPTVPQDAFDAAYLGDRDTEWVGVDTGVFGAGGNRLFVGGGEVRFAKKEAGFDHHFGIADATTRVKTVVIDDANPPVKPVSFAPTGDRFVFYFENTQTDGRPDLLGKTVFSDADGSPLAMAVYRNVADPRRFAIFLDDGVLGDGEPDFDDLIVTATGIVELRCNLEAALGDGDAAIHLVPGHPCDVSGINANELIDSMSEIIEVSDSQPEGFLETARNRLGEVKARAEAIIFQACKLVGGKPDACPVKP